MSSTTEYPEALRAWLGNDEDLLAVWKPIEVEQNEILLQVGNVAQGLYFVERGCLRCFCFHEDKDVSVQFYTEGEKVTSLNSFHHKTPSAYGLEAVESSQLWKVGKKEFDQLLKAKPQMGFILEAFISDRCELNGRRVMTLISESPERRYLRLERERPDLLERVKQSLIASYLGITPVSLSRLKARLLRRTKASIRL